jgi:hypothetical protein
MAASLTQRNGAVNGKCSEIGTRKCNLWCGHKSIPGPRLRPSGAIIRRSWPGVFMRSLRRRASLVLLLIVVVLAPVLFSQTAEENSNGAPAAPVQSAADKASPQQAPSGATDPSNAPTVAAPTIPANAPRMSKQTRFQIIRDFETQIVYSRTVFPMGTKGLRLKDGSIMPSSAELQAAIALWGPAVKPGDPAHISFVQIKDDHIHFEINGGPVHRKKWYQHVTISGANGGGITPGGDGPQENPHGSFVDLYFDRYVPELSAQQVRELLFPVLDFNAKNKEQAYLDTVPPKVKEAILAHHVLVGMNEEMVVHAKGRPPKKVREKDGETEYEEWIYGEPPQDVDFVRIAGDEVIRVETMKVGGEKILRTEKEVVLEPTDKDKEAKQQPEERPASAPSLRRPGEDSDNVPKPADSPSQLPRPTGPPIDPGNGQPGPGEIVPAR